VELDAILQDYRFTQATKESSMKGIIAWFLGVPIVLIILLYVTGIF